MTKLLSQQKTRPRIFFRLHSLTSILNMGQYKIGFLIINNEFNLHKTKKPYYVYHKTEKKNIKRGTRIESPKRSKLRLKKVRQFRRCRGHQLNRILGSLPLSFPIPIHIPRPFNAIVTWCNKLKLTKSVRQCAVCNVQLATRNVQRATRILLQLRCKCRSFRFDSFSSFYLFFFFVLLPGIWFRFRTRVLSVCLFLGLGLTINVNTWWPLIYLRARCVRHMRWRFPRRRWVTDCIGPSVHRIARFGMALMVILLEK